MNIRGVGLHRVQQGQPIVRMPSQKNFRLNGTTKSLSLALCLVLSVSNISFLSAASPGSMGATSSGSFTISLVVHPNLSVQAFSVDSATEKPTLNTSAVDETDRKTRTATQVLPESQAIKTTEAPPPKKEKTEPAEKTLPKVKSPKKPQQQICVKGSGMSHYSLQAQGDRTDNRMVLSANNGHEISYQVMLTEPSNQASVNLQQAKMFPLNNKIDCDQSPAVSIALSNTARNSLKNNHYYGTAQVIVSAE